MPQRLSPPVRELLLERTRAALDAVPGVKVVTWLRPFQPRPIFDEVVQLRYQDQVHGLGVCARQVLAERDVDRIVRRLAEPSALRYGPITPLVCSRAVPRPMRRILEDRRIGYWDSSEALYVPLPGGAIRRPGGPVAELAGTQYQMTRGTRAQVLHTLLVGVIEGRRLWRMRDIADAAGVSRPTASHIVGQLERRGWIEVAGEGVRADRRVQAPGAMLDWWTQQHDRHVTLERYVVADDQPSIPPPMVLASVSAAVSAAPDLIAGGLPACTVTLGTGARALGVEPDADAPDGLSTTPEATAQLDRYGLRRVRGGPIRVLASAEVWRRQHTRPFDGGYCASPIAVFVDLCRVCGPDAPTTRRVRALIGY